MSFLKKTDYSGRRAYAGEAGPRVGINYLRLRTSLAFAWARLQIEKFMRVGAASRQQTSSLAHHGGKRFALLETRQPGLPARRPITDIFPIRDPDGGGRNLRND